MNAERANLMTELRAQILNEGMKGLFLINGGGAVALATWLQAVWDKPWAAPILRYQVCAILAFAVGIVFGAFVHLARYLGSLHKNTLHPEKNPFWWVYIILTVSSILSFAVTSVLVFYGALNALP